MELFRLKFNIPTISAFLRQATYSPCNCELGPVHFEMDRCPLVGLCRHTCNQNSVGCLPLHRLHLLCSHPVTDTVKFLGRLIDNI